MSTRRFLRAWLVLAVALLAACAVASAVGGFLFQNAANHLADSTGPALVQVQALSSSMAEANAEATASFLATAAAEPEISVQADGEEAAEETGEPAEPVAERLHHNRYLQALRRAGEQAEEVSATVGDDAEAHAALKDISVAVAAYSGDIEAARVANTNRIGGQDRLLEGLVVVNDSILPAVDAVNARAETELSTQSDSGYSAVGLAILTALAALFVLIVGQFMLARRTRRILSPPLVVATLAVLGLLGVLLFFLASRFGATSDATDGGYESIEEIAAVQANVFRLQSELGLQLLGAPSGAEVSELEAEIELGIEAIETKADSRREQAVADQLEARWQRYIQEVAAISTLAAGGAASLDDANQRFEGEGVAAFAGVNTTLDSVLSDNTTQFLGGLDDAASAIRLLPYLGIALSVLAALAAVLGVQGRLGDYR